jgi:hypothetical protein
VLPCVCFKKGPLSRWRSKDIAQAKPGAFVEEEMDARLAQMLRSLQSILPEVLRAGSSAGAAR